MTQFTDDVIECAKLVQSRDPIRFRAAMAAPLPLRARLFTLFAFNIEMSKAAWASREPMIAEMRLQWWYDALEEIAKGGLVRRHYVITPLALAITPDQAKELQTSVEARRWDIYTDPFDSNEALQSYLRATSVPLYQVAANDSAKAITDVATAIGTANFLCAVPMLLEHKKKPLYDGRPDAVRALAKWAYSLLTSSKLTPHSRLALLSGYATRKTLQHIIAYPEHVEIGQPPLNPLIDRALFLKARFFNL